MSEPRVGVCDAHAVARAIDFAEERMQRLLVPDPATALPTDCERSWLSPLPGSPAQYEARRTHVLTLTLSARRAACKRSGRLPTPEGVA